MIHDRPGSGDRALYTLKAVRDPPAPAPLRRSRVHGCASSAARGGGGDPSLPHRRPATARREGHLASILLGRGDARCRRGVHRRPAPVERGDESVPAHALEFCGGHRPHAAGGAVEGCDGAPEGRDDHADHGDGCRRGDRDSREPHAKRRRDDDAGRPGDGGAERAPAQRRGEEGLLASDDDHWKEETEAVMNVTKCSACDSENREGARFCNACGAKIEPEAETSELKLAAMPDEDDGLAPPTNEDLGAGDSMFGPDAGEPEPTAEPEPPAADVTEPEGERSADLADVEDGGPAAATEPG